MLNAFPPFPGAALWMSLILPLVHLRAQSPPGWQSELYDDNWQSPSAGLFDSGKLIQDFSYAGYRRGEVPLPDIAGPVFDGVADFGADPSGTVDSTGNIQSALDAAAAAGGGIVFLPEGTYRIAPPSGSSAALNISGSGVVLRGAGTDRTFLLGVETAMRGKRLIGATGPTPHWGWNSGTAYPITADLLRPSLAIPVADVSPFSIGDWILIRTDITPDWVNEHNEPEWLGHESSLGGLRYHRQITEIDSANRLLMIDAPTRYAIKTRDNARVYLRNNAFSEIGLEDFSIGNLEHPGSDWGESDYSNPAKSAYDAHASYLIVFRNVRNSWIRRIHTFAAPGNGSGAHLLSNGLLLTECRGVTIADCHFQRPQYGGGGGNGYMYRLQHANECLIENSIAEFSRHGLVFSHMGSSGNVIRNCTDRTTGKATGSTGSYSTSGKSSDHHMHFSHSNLIDVCTADGSWFSANYRPFGSTPKHNLTAAHSVFWNTLCLSSPAGVAVHSEQSRYGYVIGTRGPETDVTTGGSGGTKTDPTDHVEGKGAGATLDPFSLSLDQRKRRLLLPEVDAGPDREIFFPNYSLILDSRVSFGTSEAIPEGALIGWTQLDGPVPAVFDDPSSAAPAIAFPSAGHYTFECLARSHHGFSSGDFIARDEVSISVHGANLLPLELLPTDDAYARGGSENENDNFGSTSQLWLKNVGNDHYTRESFLRFDLESLEGKTLRSADLILHALDPDTDATGSLHHLGDDTWEEQTLTWSNRPVSGTFLQNWTPDPAFRQVFDLRQVIGGELLNDRLMTLRLAVETQSNSSTIFKFASKEHGNGDLHPKIRILAEASGLSFADWIGSFPEIPPEARHPGANPDEDLNDNLGEFFHATDPATADFSPAPAWGTDGEKIFFEFVLRSAFPETARVWVEVNPTLEPGGWRILPGVRFETISLAEEQRTVRAYLPGTELARPQSFFRLRFSLDTASPE